MKNQISAAVGTRKTNIGIIITCILVFSIIIGMIGNGLFAGQAHSNYVQTQPNDFETTEYKHLQDLAEPLQKLGLMFVDGSVYPHIPNSLNLENPHIGRISAGIPVRISSEVDADLLLQAIRLAALTAPGISWDTDVDDAIAKAGLNDYLMDGFREITRPKREKEIIYLAAKYSFPELVGKIFIHRPQMLEEFQALGFFQGYDLGIYEQRTPVDYGIIYGDGIIYGK